MPLLALPNELILLIASQLSAAGVNALLQANHSLAWLLEPLLYDLAALPCCAQLVLSWAAARGFERLLSNLLDRGVVMSTSHWDYALGFTPLQKAAHHGHVGVTALLLQRLPEKCAIILSFAYSLSPLELAPQLGHLDVLGLLLPNTEPSNILAALANASERGDMAIVALLLLHAPNSRLAKPLRRAAAGGHVDIVTLLLPHVPHEQFTGPLESASWNGHINVLSLLVDTFLARNSSQRYTPPQGADMQLLLRSCSRASTLTPV